MLDAGYEDRLCCKVNANGKGKVQQRGHDDEFSKSGIKETGDNVKDRADD